MVRITTVSKDKSCYRLLIRQNNDQKYEEKVPMHIVNGSVDKCDVINKDYNF